MTSSARVVSIVLLIAACDSPASDPTTPVPPEQPVQPAQPSSTGAVLIRLTTRGVDVDPNGYVVWAQSGSTYRLHDASVGINDSVLIRHSTLGNTSSWYIQLRDVEPNCWIALPNLRSVALREHEITRVDYIVDCTSPESLTNYDRTTPHGRGTTAFHGALSEQYILNPDGRFRLRFQSSRYGIFEYFGNYTRGTNGELEFAWDGDGRWAATATVQSDTLDVKYNDIMIGSDFEPGMFVRPRLNQR